MIDNPWIDEMPEQPVALVPITVARNQIQTVMMPALTEIRTLLKAQGIEPAGPWLTHHHYLKPDEFNFDICVPVNHPITPQGRVQPGILNRRRVARTVLRGRYEGLAEAWRSLMSWVAAEHLSPCIDFFECYAKGFETSADPGQWETVLSIPLMD
jgi:effector-binding domain-containing protein